MHRMLIILVGFTFVDLLLWILERVLDAIDLVAKTVGFAEKFGVVARTTAKWRS